MADEQAAAFAAEWGALTSTTVCLPPTSSPADLPSLVQDPSSTVVALDFDQTITETWKDPDGTTHHGLRGGEESRLALQQLHDDGAHLVVVTATQATVDAVRQISENINELGLGSVFHTAELNKEPILAHLRNAYGDNSALDYDQLTAKLAVLIVLNSKRLVADLSRVGVTATEVTEGSVSYRLQTVGGVNDKEWSAEQTLEAGEEEAVCPVRCWEVYHDRSAEYRVEDGPDRLFVDTAGEALGPEQLETVVEDMLVAAGSSPRGREPCGVDALFANPAVVHVYEDVKLARMGNVICARYNKPEAVQMFIEDGGLSPEMVVFADDNPDNVFNMYIHFAQREKADENARPVVQSVWMSPPEKGRLESGSGMYQPFVEAVAAANGGSAAEGESGGDAETAPTTTE